MLLKMLKTFFPYTKKENNHMANSTQYVVYTRNFKTRAKQIGVFAEPASNYKVDGEVNGGKIKYKNLVIDQQKRWNIVTRLCSYNVSDAENMISTETKNDPGDLGEKRAFLAKAAFPNVNIKREYWNMFTSKEQKFSTDYLSFGMYGFFCFNQKDILEPFVDKFFDDLKDVYKNKDLSRFRFFK